MWGIFNLVNEILRHLNFWRLSDNYIWLLTLAETSHSEGKYSCSWAGWNQLWLMFASNWVFQCTGLRDVSEMMTYSRWGESNAGLKTSRLSLCMAVSKQAYLDGNHSVNMLRVSAQLTQASRKPETLQGLCAAFCVALPGKTWQRYLTMTMADPSIRVSSCDLPLISLGLVALRLKINKGTPYKR